MAVGVLIPRPAGREALPRCRPGAPGLGGAATGATYPASDAVVISARTLADQLPTRARLHVPAGAPADAVLTDVTHDSRQAAAGVLYAARPGVHHDGHDFAPAAVEAGSPALLVERVLDLPVPQVVVDTVAEALGHAAAVVHGHPSRDVVVIGVTGTNGKTTSTFMLQAVVQAAGGLGGLIGTVLTRVGDDELPGVRTTPEGSDLQRVLARMRDRGASHVAMEVSSHGLALGRVEGVAFAAALFTNLSQDHLDFHSDMEAYFAAKRRLFAPERSRLAVVTVDDGWGRRLADERPDAVTVSVTGPADVRAAIAQLHADRSCFDVTYADGERVSVALPLPGRFNVANATGVLAVADALGLPRDRAVEGLQGMAGVPGRMEPVSAGQDFGVVVDYAHTPDAVAGVLATARELAAGRVIVVIGCGGDRDAAKRPQMGVAAAAGADLAILTSDNPRTEDPVAILEAMAAGARQTPAAGEWRVVVDRTEAIHTALAAARPGDLVVLAGKGHETYQELADGRIDYDDRVVARQWLEAR